MKSRIKAILKKYIKLLSNIKNKNKYVLKKDLSKYKFISREKGCKRLVVVLAGFRLQLADVVYKRLKVFTPENTDICIISCGKYCVELEEIAKINNWSYISFKHINISNALNITIKLFKSAKLIYKIDEDIFITKHYFESIERMYDYYNSKENNDEAFKPGLYSPLIPLHSPGAYYFLKKMNLIDEYKNKFGLLKEMFVDFKMWNTPESTYFFWFGDERITIPKIDVLDQMFYKTKQDYVLTNCRCLISSIMFDRDFFDKMGGFPVNLYNAGLGEDERYLCYYSSIYSFRPIAICCNTCVGHFSTGQLYSRMLNFYYKNKEKYDI